MNKRLQSFIFATALLLIASANTFAGGFTYKLTVRGLENTEVILANYYGDKQYVKDTFQFDKKGTLTLKADTSLPGGIYMLVFPALGNKYFEFIVGEPAITIETDTSDLVGHLKVLTSKENSLFYDDLKFIGEMRKQLDSVNVLYKATNDPKLKEIYMARLKDIDAAVKVKRNSITDLNPESFYGKFLKAMKEIDVPDFPRDEKGAIKDSSWQWRYYKAHYWDNYDMRDDRILRSPIFHNKLKTFMTQTTVQQPDSVIASGEALISLTDRKTELYRYVVTYIFNEAANSKIMGMDGAYVFFGKKYFCNPDMTPWIDTAKRFKICDRVTRLEPVIVGKPAQRLVLWTDSTEKERKALYDVKAKWTILAFWDPDCGHCKKEMPVLVEAYHNLKKKGVSVEVYSPAIMDMDNYKDWLEFIQKNNMDWINVADPHRHSNFRWEWDLQSTPQMYILDKDKKIIARRIGAEQVEDYIRHLEDPTYRPKSIMKIDDEETHEGTE